MCEDMSMCRPPIYVVRLPSGQELEVSDHQIHLNHNQLPQQRQQGRPSERPKLQRNEAAPGRPPPPAPSQHRTQPPSSPVPPTPGTLFASVCFTCTAVDGSILQVFKVTRGFVAGGNERRLIATFALLASKPMHHSLQATWQDRSLVCSIQGEQYPSRQRHRLAYLITLHYSSSPTRWYNRYSSRRLSVCMTAGGGLTILAP